MSVFLASRNSSSFSSCVFLRVRAFSREQLLLEDRRWIHHVSARCVNTNNGMLLLYKKNVSKIFERKSFVKEVSKFFSIV